MRSDVQPSAPDRSGHVRLAFDTSGSTGSVAVAEGDRILLTREIEERLEQAARLVPTIDDALGAAGVGLADLAEVVVGEGPGSFTGVRVAAATAKGLTRALGLPLRAVSSLAAEALAHKAAGPIRFALFDARADRVYAACYGVGSATAQELVPPRPSTVREVLAGDVPPGAVFVGDGARRHRGAIEGAGFDIDEGLSARPLAEGLLLYLALRPDLAPVPDPASWEPAYVRAWSAEPLWSA